MPVIRLNDSTFMNLKSVSTWLGTQTPSEAIGMLIKEKMKLLDLEHDEKLVDAEDVSGGILFKDVPGLTHTKVLSSKVNNNAVKNLKWGKILLAVIQAVKDEGLSKEKLSVELQINAEPYKVEDKGYTFYPELGLSVQGQSAPDAWKEAQRLANKYKIPVDVKFKWREKEGAQYPGKIGLMKAGL